MRSSHQEIQEVIHQQGHLQLGDQEQRHQLVLLKGKDTNLHQLIIIIIIHRLVDSMIVLDVSPNYLSPTTSRGYQTLPGMHSSGSSHSINSKISNLDHSGEQLSSSGGREREKSDEALSETQEDKPIPSIELSTSL